MSRAEPPGPLVGAGRAADVYDIGAGRVLRRYRVPFDVQAEAAVMQHLDRAGDRYDRAAVAAAVGETVRRQLDAGVDIINDGEPA